MSKPEEIPEVVSSIAPLNGTGQRPAMRPGVVITVDNDTGRAPVIESAEDTKSVGAIIARAQARIEAKRATSTPVAVEVAETPEQEAPVDAAPEPEQAAAAGGDDDIVDPEAPAETPDDLADPGAPAAEPVKAKAAPAATPYEIEQARIDAAAARRELAEARAGRQQADFDGYFETPVASLKAWVAGTLGVSVDSPLVAAEVKDLFSELTWDVVSSQDLPDSQQATLQAERLNRKIRLDTHRRQASQRDTATSEKERRALNLANTEIGKLRDSDPAKTDALVSFAEARTGQPFAELVMDTLHRAAQEGRISVAGKSDSAIFNEGIQLLRDHFTREAQQIAPHIAALTPASAPSTPGTTTKPNVTRPTAASQAAPKALVKPRTLPVTKAGAAPSRPGTPTQQTEPEELSRDPETRRQQIADRYSRR